MDTRSLLRVLGSLRFAAVILVMLCIAMACATVYEATHGTPAALIVFYKSWWFELLLSLLAANLLASMLARYPWSRRHVGFLVTHTSVIVILLGAWVTKQWGINGQASILEGQSTREFATDQDALTLGKPGQKPVRSVDLTGGIGGVRPLTLPSTRALEADGVRAVVETYLPDSEWAERVTDDNPSAKLALEINLSSDGESTQQWVFADDPAASISVRAVANAGEMEQFLTAPTSQPASAKTVKLEIAGAAYEFPLEQCLAAPVPVGQTGYTIKVLRYLPHALVGENKQLTSASNQPVNPAIETEVSGPNGTEKRYAFARFPDFGSMHGTQSPTADVKLTFNAPSNEQAKTLIEVAAGPENRLAVRFNPPTGEPVRRPITLGQTIETPWPGMQLSVSRRFENAQRESALQAVSPPREDRVPAIAVSLQAGQDRRQVWVRKHEPQTAEIGGNTYELAYAEKMLPLGFELKLNKFHLGTYPGTGRPRSFESHVTLVSEGGSEENRIISMNHPATFGGYSLFQSSYQQGRSGTTSVLSVSWDPGLPIVFGGYVTLVLGLLYQLAVRMRRRKNNGTNGASEAGGSGATGGLPASAETRSPELSTKRSARAKVGRVVAIGLVALAAFQPVPARAQNTKLPAKVSMDAIRGLPVQHDGRWMPLDTVARDKVNAITGEKVFRDQDAVRLLLAWTFNPQPWMSEPLITIGSAELRRELKLAQDRSVFSYAELVRHQPLLDQIDHLSHRAGKGKMDPLESKVSDINEKLLDLQQVFKNEVIKPIPDAQSMLGAWQPITLDGVKPEAYTPVQAAWSQLKTAFLNDDAAGFDKAAAAVSAALANLPAAHRPTAEKVATELQYNRLSPYTLAWRLMALGAVFAAAALRVQRRWFDAVAILGLMAGFAALSYGMYLRWQIAGRIPASNMFESLLFLSWGAGAFAIVAMLFLKDRSVPFTASAIGALSLFLADTLPIDHFIRPVAPVLLDTVWMSIHVPGIMVSYAVLALAAFIAHIQMVVMALAPRERKLIDQIDAMHYWYMHVGVILLGAGIITGSMWAAFSWGRYWGWDPKEVWSLVAFLAYLVIMHVRVDREQMPAWSYIVGAGLGVALFAIVAPRLAPLSVTTGLALAAAALAGVLFVTVRGQFASAFKSTVAFWFIIMTYLGVNYVLGIGLHSYGFGTGAVVHYMMLTGSIDLAIIGLLAVVYLARTRQVNGLPATLA